MNPRPFSEIFNNSKLWEDSVNRLIVGKVLKSRGNPQKFYAFPYEFPESR
ncbi:MAG: hypothetical protein H7A24_13460 [Leptospiraceae bacterium]|nr:hypothetical protein [Leptospiraceae bacterium]MCP5512886.1 hypothetical protein [Leptospiraceae bacterium]